MATLPPGHHPMTCIIREAVWLTAAATITCHLEEATILRDLRIGNLLDTTEGTIPGQSRQKDPRAHLQTLTVSNTSDFVSLPH